MPMPGIRINGPTITVAVNEPIGTKCSSILQSMKVTFRNVGLGVTLKKKGRPLCNYDSTDISPIIQVVPPTPASTNVEEMTLGAIATTRNGSEGRPSFSLSYQL